jgi:predicted transcriptional regulator
MSQTITIELPDETKNALDDAAREDGVSERSLVEKAVADYLFVRRFRTLRDRPRSKGKRIQDEDVFDLVS